MRNYLRLFIFTLVLSLLSGASGPFSFRFAQALAACTIEGSQQSDPTAGASEPADNEVVTCSDADTAGVDASESNGVTVTVASPDGSISVTDAPGIRLGDGATVVIEAPDRPVTVQGNDVPGIEVGDDANVTVEGVVSTSGDFSPAIATGSNATVIIDGGEGRRQITDTENEVENGENGNGSEVVIVSDGGIVSTTGAQSAAVTVGAGSTVTATGQAQIATTGADADAVVLNGEGSRLNVNENATVQAAGSAASAVQMNGVGSRLEVSGTVSGEAEGTAAVLGTGDGIVLTVQNGGMVTALSAGGSAIEMTGTGARIAIADGGEIKVTAGNSVAIIAGSGATVTVEGTVSATGDGSQGITIGDGASLTVESTGKIETSQLAAQAVQISEAANNATVDVASGAVVEATGGQAIVDAGDTNTDVTIDGSVTGGADAPVVALNGGNDTVTVNGSVSSTSTGTVIDLGSGDDTLNDNSSQTISGASVLAEGGEGTDTLNLNNGKINDSADYQGFEVTNVGTNTNPDDPLNGDGSTLNVTDDQSGNEINVDAGSTLNVLNGGTVDLRSDNSDNPSGVSGNSINFESGSAVNVQAENTTGEQPEQTFSNTTFAPDTVVNTSSGFVRGVASNNEDTGVGTIALRSDFTNGARTENTASFSAALNALADSAALTSEQQAALDALIADVPSAAAAEATLSELSGEVRAQAASSGIQSAVLFNSVLLPGGARTYSRRAPISTRAEKQLGSQRIAQGRLAQRTNPLDDITPLDNSVWVTGFGGAFDIDTNDVSTAFDASTYGVAVGYDRAVGPGGNSSAVFGIGAGYATTDVNGLSDDATIDTFSVGTYIEGSRGPLYGNAAASYSSQSISGSAGNGDGNIFVASAEGFYNLMPDNKLTAGPLATVGAAFGSYSGFTTSNDAFSAAYDSADVSQLMAGLGVRVGGQNQIDIGLLSLNLDLLYESALGDDTIEFAGQFADSEVSIAAPSANNGGFLLGAEADLAFSERASVGFRYQGRLGDDIQSHTGEVRFSILF